MVPINVAEAVEPPRIARVEVRALSAREMQKLLEAATGMRRGEILGLQWKDIDFEQRRVMVRRSLQPLRHTAASLMLEQGVAITTVAAILGHANTSTTLSVYAHAIKGSEQAGAAIMDNILKGA